MASLGIVLAARQEARVAAPRQQNGDSVKVKAMKMAKTFFSGATRAEVAPILGGGRVTR